MYNQASLLDCCHDEKLTVIRGDARDKKLVSKYLKNVDGIFPLACLTGAPLCEKNPIAAEAVNLEAVKMMLELRSKDQVIIFPNTNSGYGIGQKGTYCTEETPLNPISLYDRLKVELEKILLEAGNILPCDLPRHLRLARVCASISWSKTLSTVRLPIVPLFFLSLISREIISMSVMCEGVYTLP